MKTRRDGPCKFFAGIPYLGLQIWVYITRAKNKQTTDRYSEKQTTSPYRYSNHKQVNSCSNCGSETFVGRAGRIFGSLSQGTLFGIQPDTET